MKIEKVSTADAEELLAIYAPYVEETAISFEYEVPSVDEFRNRIEQISAKYPYIKAVVDGKIAGYAYAAGFKDRKAYDWSVETTIYIRKDCRRFHNSGYKFGEWYDMIWMEKMIGEHEKDMPDVRFGQ